MLTFESSLTFTASAEPIATLVNFSPPEEGFAWQMGRWGEVAFDFMTPAGGTTFPCDLIIDMDVYKHETLLEGQHVFTYFNGIRLNSAFITSRRVLVLALSSRLLKRHDNVLTFDTPDSKMPSSFGFDDGRQLGIQLFSLQVRKS